MIKGFLSSAFLSPLFFSCGAALVFLFAFGFVIPPLFILGKVLLILLAAFVLADGIILYGPGMRLSAKREIPRVLGIGDDIPIKLELEYQGKVELKAEVIEELPEELQERNFSLSVALKPGIHTLPYTIRPVSRGVYSFGLTQVLIESPLGLLKRKISLDTSEERPVYPSIQQMREMGLLAFNRMSVQMGAKKLNRLGKSYEFEQITPFVEGDDFRNVNWKATGKTRELMVNQFQDERSQNLYCVISKGRAMKLTFDGLSLLDYAVNATLALSNVALRKFDKVGLLTFSNKVGTAIRAENRKGQLQKILEALYAEKEREHEPSYELLYRSLDRLAHTRSLVLLFVNFETPQMLERSLPILQKIRRKHMLIAVLFKDKELEHMSREPKTDAGSIYRQTLAAKFLHEREEIARKLRSHGIHAVVSTPEQLSINTINKYLELKARGMV